MFGGFVNGSVGFVFVINVFGIIIFFFVLIFGFYYLGIMLKVINFIGGGL